MILNKRVDVKSADDYQGKGPEEKGGGHGRHHGGGGNHGNMHGGGNRGSHGQGRGNNLLVAGANGQTIQKPNPYVQVEQPGAATEDNQGSNVKFTYPKSKIFVGGLDFKLTSEELKEHF